LSSTDKKPKLVNKTLDFVRGLPPIGGISHQILIYSGAQKARRGRNSGTYISWLEATPTFFYHGNAFCHILTRNLWERHLAAIFEHFEAAHNDDIGQKMMV
jgi:hypothetical protein